MTLDPRKSPVAFSTLSGWGLFTLAAILPIWKQPHGLGTMWIAAYDRPLWAVASFLPTEVELWGPWRTIQGHLGNIALFATVFCLGGAFGRAYYWWRWERRPPELPHPWPDETGREAREVGNANGKE